MNSVILKYSLSPISVNKAYMTRFGYRVLSPDARQFKVEITSETLSQLSSLEINKIQSWGIVRVSIDIYSDSWMTKKQTVRRKDVASYEKLLTDSVFSGLGIDDSLIFSLSLNKFLGAEQIIYRIEPYVAQA